MRNTDVSGRVILLKLVTNVKFALEDAMNAQTGSRGIDLLFL